MTKKLIYLIAPALLCGATNAAVWTEYGQEDLVASWEVEANTPTCSITPMTLDIGRLEQEKWTEFDTTLEVDCQGMPANYKLGFPIVEDIYKNYPEYPMGKSVLAYKYVSDAGFDVYVAVIPTAINAEVGNAASYAGLNFTIEGRDKHAHLLGTDITGKKTYSLKTLAFLPKLTTPPVSETSYTLTIPVLMKAVVK